MNIFDPKNNFELLDYLRILLRRKWYFMIPFLVIISSGGYFIAIKKPQYESFCIVEIQRTQHLGNLERVIPGISSEYQRYASLKSQIINSRNLDEVVNRLDLINDAEFERALDEHRPSPSEEIDEDLARYFIHKKLRKAISVKIVNDNVKLSVRLNSPEKAYQIVKTLTEIFMESFLERELINVESSKRFIVSQLSSFRKKLEASEARLNSFKGNLSGSRQIVEKLDKDAINRLNEANMAIDLTLKEKNDHLNYINSRLLGRYTITEYPKTPAILLILTEVESKAEKMAELMKHFSWSSSEVVKINRSINELRYKILNEIEEYLRTIPNEFDATLYNLILDKAITLVDIDIAIKKEEALKSVLKLSENSAVIAQAQELTLKKLQQEVDINRKIYELFLEQKQGSYIEEAIQQANATSRFNIIEPAQKPLEAESSGRRILAVVTLLLGLGSGVASVYFREFFDKSIYTVAGIEELFGIEVVGVISNLPQEVILPEQKIEEGIQSDNLE